MFSLSMLHCNLECFTLEHTIDFEVHAQVLIRIIIILMPSVQYQYAINDHLGMIPGTCNI